MGYRRLAILSSVTAPLASALLLAGCGGGGSPGSHVARLGTTTTQTSAPSTGSGSAGPSTGGAPTISQTLAYSHCMRSHGVPTFPDPNSSGQIPKTEVVSASKSNPSRFDSADSACRHLLPNGGNGETPAQIAQDWSEFRDFARCMRSHGVSNWPDPTSRSTTDRRPAFDITAVGLDGHSPQLRATAQQCALLVHLGGLPPAH